MKKVFIIAGILILVLIGLYFGMVYHARRNASDWGGMVNPDAAIGEDGEYYIPDETMLDGDFTYVDNEKLLERIVGRWMSEDGSYSMTYGNDYHMTVMQDSAELLSTRADFVYLQPGEPACTDFRLEVSAIKDTAGNDWGEVESCYHFLENGEDRICLSIYLPDAEDVSDGEIVLQFQKVK